jgi:hypothetical protein
MHTALTQLPTVPIMPPASVGNAQSVARQSEQRAIKMADKGKGDKGKKEPRKKPALTLKEKRKAKNDKKGNE